MGIIGKSGTGKSTFLKLLARMYEPTRGTISYGAFDRTKVFFSKTVAYMDQVRPLPLVATLGCTTLAA